MNVSHHGRLSVKASALRAILLLGCLALILALVACAGEKEEGATTPGASPTAAATGTPAGTPGAAGEVPGVNSEIVLGADAILSGAMGAVYKMIPDTQAAYFRYINDTQGGVCGREIVYKVEDNGDDPAKGLEAAKKLVEKDRVFAFVGSLGDHPHSAVWEYLNDNGIPDLLVSAGAHQYGADYEGHPWTTQMIPDYRIEGTFFGQYISKNLPGEKVAILYENDVFGQDGRMGVKDGLDPQKNELVSEQAYEASALTVRSQVANMKNAGATVVVLYATPAFTAQAIQEADRLGWHPQWLMSYVNSDPMVFQFVSPELLEGSITFQAYKLADWTDDPAVAEHYQIMNKYGGPTPGNFTIYAQSIAELAVDVLSRTCDNLTREGLMAAMESTTGWHSDLMLEGVNVTISDTDHTALDTGRMLKATVVNGKGKWEYFGEKYSFEQ